ncbi:MAG TPA: hypothetical protein VFS44_04895 [Gemmatimonadaceae bacterium]|nr:hypothetical protein [Gemmatimonadaceae bacterium]
MTTVSPPSTGSPRSRGTETGQATMFSYVDLEQRIPADHPLRFHQDALTIQSFFSSLLVDSAPADSPLPSPLTPYIPP